MRRRAETIARLEQEEKAREAAEAKVEKLKEALQTIITGIPRPEAGERWRSDGKPSKADTCKHGRFLYEDCEDCVADFASAALREAGEMRIERDLRRGTEAKAEKLKKLRSFIREALVEAVYEIRTDRLLDFLDKLRALSEPSELEPAHD